MFWLQSIRRGYTPRVGAPGPGPQNARLREANETQRSHSHTRGRRPTPHTNTNRNTHTHTTTTTTARFTPPHDARSASCMPRRYVLYHSRVCSWSPQPRPRAFTTSSGSTSVRFLCLHRHEVFLSLRCSFLLLRCHDTCSARPHVPPSFLMRTNRGLARQRYPSASARRRRFRRRPLRTRAPPRGPRPRRSSRPRRRSPRCLSLGSQPAGRAR